MVLDIVESHLYRSYPEVVRTEIEHWQIKFLHNVSRYYTSVIACIIQ